MLSFLPSLRFQRTMNTLRKKLLALALSCLLLPAARAQTSLNSGLLGRFPLDGNSADATGNMGNSTDFGVAYAADARGQANAALRLNGSGRVEIAPNGLLDFGTTGSFSFSVAFRTLSSGTQSFFTNRGNATAGGAAWPVGWRLGFDNAQAGRVYLDLFGFLPNFNASLGLATQGLFNDGLWHTAATTVNRATQQVRVYVDGVAQPLVYVSTNPTYGTITGTVFQYGQQLAATMSLNPGYDSSGLLVNSIGANFNGSLDEARFYNRVLNVAEVQALYAQALASAPVAAGAGLAEVFPNPATDGVVRLRLPAGLPVAEVAVFTALGQVIRPTIRPVSAQEMQISGLPTGLYAVRVRRGSTTQVRRFEVR